MAPDLLIVGAGPVGLALALALKDTGLSLALADARSRSGPANDPRVLALAQGTRLTLERLGVWGHFPVTPITTIHISQQGALGRTRLQAADYGLPALGYVAEAGALAQALDQAVRHAGIPILEDSPVTALTPQGERIAATLAGPAPQTLHPRLVACAEGGLQGGEPGIVAHDYGQTAVITQVTPRQPHHNTAWERFTPQGPLALLPLGPRYAVVHTTTPAQAQQLLTLTPAAYGAELESHFGGRLGLAQVAPLLAYPLALRYRRQPVGERTVWLGNAAQTLHPVAGQGFNLALRDVWALARCLASQPADPGAPALLAAYARERRLDRYGTIGFTDGLVQLFSNHIALLRHARGAGLLALDLFPPLRHLLAKRMMFGARAWP